MYESGDYARENPTWDIEDSPWKATKVLEFIHENNL
ncbi:methylase, partial [Candidatus Parcubacteria bacterium]